MNAERDAEIACGCEEMRALETAEPAEGADAIEAINVVGPRNLPLTRRDVLRAGLLGAAGMWMADRCGRLALAASNSAASGAGNAALPKAKAVIQIWMWGGPCHIDTFDPKPEAGYDYCGPLAKPIPTNVDGVFIGELMPLLAQQADKYSIVRSMTHNNNAHETASYIVQTGQPAGERIVYPGMGAVVSLMKGYKADYHGLIPPYVVLTKPQGRFSEAGFLGPSYKPFATGGDPNQNRFMVEGVVAQGITDKRQQDRRDLLHKLDALGSSLHNDARLTAMMQGEEQAYDLILGDAGKVFDLSQEKDALRDAYGRSTFGQSCLMARRLVERGVRFVTINYEGWDTHKQHFQTMRRKLPEFDKGMSTLLTDLAARGMLDNTIVWCSGEFGRTPRVQWEPPWNGGRGHFGQAFSAVVAGGGFHGGHVVGRSDEHGESVVERPVYPWDLVGTMYELLGIDPDGSLPHPMGLETHITPRAADGVKSGGRLREIV